MENPNQETEEKDQDEIDLAISEFVDKLVPSDDDEEWEAVSDLVFDVVSDLVDDGKIQDIPAEDATPEEKQSWLSDSFPQIEASVKEAMDNEEPEETEPEAAE